MHNNYIMGACALNKIKLFDLSYLEEKIKPVGIYCHETEHNKFINSLSFSEDNLLCCCVSDDESLSLFAV